MSIAERVGTSFFLVGAMTALLGVASAGNIDVGAPQMPEPTESLPGPELDVLPPWLDSIAVGSFDRINEDASAFLRRLFCPR